MIMKVVKCIKSNTRRPKAPRQLWEVLLKKLPNPAQPINAYYYACETADRGRCTFGIGMGEKATSYSPSTAVKKSATYGPYHECLRPSHKVTYQVVSLSTKAFPGFGLQPIEDMYEFVPEMLDCRAC